jgi:mannose-6-phosphate isomerase-like protein (cupin superfamily)
MSHCGDVYENRVTGEYAVILRGTEDRGDGPGIAHLRVRPGGAVVGEHIHPHIVESFTLIRGLLEAKIAGKVTSLVPGERTTVAPNVPHDWWNASRTDEAHVLVEVAPAPGSGHIDADRFEMMIGMLFGLANDGKVDKKGRPTPLQASLILREFADIVVFTSPPPAVQRMLFGVLAPIATALGYKALEPRYLRPHGHVTPDPEALKAAGLES